MGLVQRMHKKGWHWQRRGLPKHLLREPLALTPLQLLTPVAKLLGKPHQPLATNRGKGSRVHVILHLLHAPNKVTWGFVKLVVCELAVQKLPDVSDGRFV